MPTFTSEIEVELTCSGCGRSLGSTVNESRARQGIYPIRVDICEICLDREKKKAHDEGYSEAEGERSA